MHPAKLQGDPIGGPDFNTQVVHQILTQKTRFRQTGSQGHQSDRRQIIRHSHWTTQQTRCVVNHLSLGPQTQLQQAYQQALEDQKIHEYRDVGNEKTMQNDEKR